MVKAASHLFCEGAPKIYTCFFFCSEKGHQNYILMTYSSYVDLCVTIAIEL